MNLATPDKPVIKNARRSVPRSWLILLGLLTLLFLGSRLWVNESSVKNIPVVDADSVAKTLRNAQLERLADRTTGKLIPMQESLRKRAIQFNLSEDELRKRVDATEISRMRSDEHLVRALNAPFSTPFINANSKTPESSALRKRLVGILIDDYERNSFAVDRIEIAQQMRELNSLGSSEFVNASKKLSETIRSDSDPLVIYISELIYAPKQKKHTLFGFDGLSSRKCSPLLGFLLSMDLLSQPDSPSHSRGIAVEQFASLLPSTWQLIRGDREAEIHFLSFVEAYLSINGSEANLFFLKALDESKIEVPDAAVHAAMGNLLEDIAWTWRGNSLAKDISETAWKEYSQFIDLARLHYLAAWCDYPDVVGFSSELLLIEMQTGKTGRSVDAWFRHGMSAPNYSSGLLRTYINASLSRWGGSDEKLVWLTGEILDCDNARLDFLESSYLSFRRLWNDNNDRMLMDQMDLVEPALNIIDKLDSMIATDGSLHPEFAVMLAKILWDSSELRDLHFFLERFGKPLDPSLCITYRLNKDLMMLMSSVAVESDYDSWIAIHKELFLNMNNQPDGQAKVLELLDAMPNTGKSQKFLDAQSIVRDWIERNQAYSRGETVSLDFKREGIEWASSGRASINSDRSIELICETSSDSVLLKSLQKFAKPYALQYEVKQLDTSPDPLGVAFFSRPVSGSLHESSDCFEMRVSPSIMEARFGICDYWKHERMVHQTKPLLDGQKQFLILVEIRKNSASFSINGLDKDVVTGDFEDYSPLVFGRKLYVSGIGTPGINATYRISNIQIQKLND